MVQREEVVALPFAVYDMVDELRRIRLSWRAMGKRKKIRTSEEERAAWEAHVDETLDRLWTVATRAEADFAARSGRPVPVRIRPPRARLPMRRSERAAWDAHVNDTLGRLRLLAEKALRDLEDGQRDARDAGA